MEDIKEVLEIFDTPEKWNAYIELTRTEENIKEMFGSSEKWNAFVELKSKREDLVKELENRLYLAIYALQNKNVTGNWNWKFERGKLKLHPKGYEDKVGIGIEFINWQSQPGYERCVGIWTNPQKVDVKKFVNQINLHENIQLFRDYERIPSDWLPFARKIPASVFEVEDKITSYEECLFPAIRHPEKLAKKLWDDVFKPFATKESAEDLSKIANTCLKGNNS